MNYAIWVLAAILGFASGWNSNEKTTEHRYIMALAQRHEAETSYWLNKLNDEIQTNKGDIAKERTHAKR
jgi:hypothetical protein